MKLQDFIKKELGLQDNRPKEATEILLEKETELNNAISQIKQLKSKYRKQIAIDYFKKWEESLRLAFPDLKIVGDKFKLDASVINRGVKFSIENKEFVAIIECNNCDNPTIYFGIGRQFVSNEKFTTPKALQIILETNKLTEPEDFWYGWRYTKFEDAYLELETLINKILSSN